MSIACLGKKLKRPFTALGEEGVEELLARTIEVADTHQVDDQERVHPSDRGLRGARKSRDSPID